MTEQEWEDKLDEVQKHSENWYNKWKQSEEKIADIKANCDLAIEGRDIKIKELEKENRLLGERCNQLLKDKGNLTDELAKWKDEWQEQVQKGIDEGYARTQQTIQLTKATEIIKGLYFIIQSRIDYENNTGIADEMWRAEQFLKEIEK